MYMYNKHHVCGKGNRDILFWPHVKNQTSNILAKFLAAFQNPVRADLPTSGPYPIRIIHLCLNVPNFWLKFSINFPKTLLWLISLWYESQIKIMVDTCICTLKACYLSSEDFQHLVNFVHAREILREMLLNGHWVYCILFIYLFINFLFINCLFIYLFIYLFVYIFVHILMYLFIHWFIHWFLYIYIFIYLSFIDSFIYLCTYLFIHLFLNLMLFESLPVQKFQDRH